jgi:cytochrome c oxidase cbb3-type subunit 1
MLIMLWNVVMTMRQGRVVDVPVLAVNPAHA